MLNIEQILENDDFIGLKKSIEQGLNLNQIIEDDEGDEYHILIYAMRQKCSYDLLKLMVDNNSNLFYTNSDGVGILDEAIILGDLDFLKYLINEKKMDINKTQRKSGFSFLMQAVSYGNIELTKFLLESGADIEMRDEFGMNCIDYARKLGRKKMQEFLINY